MRIEELYKKYGTWTGISLALRIGRSTIDYWRKIGYIPWRSQCAIERDTNGLFKADIDDARPPIEDKNDSKPERED